MTDQDGTSSLCFSASLCFLWRDLSFSAVASSCCVLSLFTLMQPHTEQQKLQKQRFPPEEKTFVKVQNLVLFIELLLKKLNFHQITGEPLWANLHFTDMLNNQLQKLKGVKVILRKFCCSHISIYRRGRYEPNHGLIIRFLETWWVLRASIMYHVKFQASALMQHTGKLDSIDYMCPVVKLCVPAFMRVLLRPPETFQQIEHTSSVSLHQ